MKKVIFTLLFLSSFLGLENATAQTLIPIPPHSTPYTGTVRGFWFTAPVNFTITGLRVPPEAGAGDQFIQVVKINDVPPAAWPTISPNITTLSHIQNAPNGAIQPVNIAVAAGDIIGVLGSVGSGTSVSYSANATPFASSIAGNPIMLRRFLHQGAIIAAPAPNYSTEGDNFPIGRVEIYYRTNPPAPVIIGAKFYCSGSDIRLISRPPAGYENSDYSFVWTFPDGSTHTDSIYNFPNAQAGAAGPTGWYKTYMTVDTGIGPLDTSAVDSFYLYVQQTPPPPAVQRLITYCQNAVSDTIPIYGQNIKWYSTPTGGTAVTVQPTINTAVPGTFTYYVS
ncbi:MAG TPA: hypothetical protein VL098_02100, partial [Flavipsychrobacter sp.]|nr:hypothetical protein [Flavipsychrobacter sp.]